MIFVWWIVFWGRECLGAAEADATAGGCATIAIVQSIAIAIAAVSELRTE